MTCTDAREQFSDLVDDRLGTAEQIALDAHVEGCAACRHELDRFRATVTLVRSLEPARAPVGFVDRVTAAARPRPWWRRVAAGAFSPLPIKLPIEAAAVLLVGLGVAYLFQRTPELRHATRDETTAITQPQAPAEAPAAKADAPRPFADAPAPPRVAEEERAVAQAPAGPRSAPAAPPPAAETPAGAGAKAEVTEPPVASIAPPRAREEDNQVRAERKAAAPPAPARSADDVREQSKDLARQSGQRADAPRLAAKSARTADVSATLRVASRPAAESAVRELVTRHRGTVDATRAEPGITVIEARIPRDDYAGFAAGLAAIGRGEPSRHADLPAEVRVIIRLE